MVNNDEHYSGASWEYVRPDRSPGIGLFTSLAHPWGAAPTYVLPEYLLGVAPTTPGYKMFVITPVIGYLGLSEVSGTVPTTCGEIEVSRTNVDKDVTIEIVVPEGVQGVLEIPGGYSCASEGAAKKVKLQNGQCKLILSTM